MKKNYFFIFLFFSINFIFGQGRNLIKGKLLYKNTSVVAANVINNTAQLTTITDSNGEFEIEVTNGDEVIFSSVQYRIKSIIITPDILKKNRLVVSVNEKYFTDYSIYQEYLYYKNKIDIHNRYIKKKNYDFKLHLGLIKPHLYDNDDENKCSS